MQKNLIYLVCLFIFSQSLLCMPTGQDTPKNLQRRQPTLEQKQLSTIGHVIKTARTINNVIRHTNNIIDDTIDNTLYEAAYQTRKSMTYAINETYKVIKNNTTAIHKSICDESMKKIKDQKTIQPITDQSEASIPCCVKKKTNRQISSTINTQLVHQDSLDKFTTEQSYLSLTTKNFSCKTQNPLIEDSLDKEMKNQHTFY